MLNNVKQQDMLNKFERESQPFLEEEQKMPHFIVGDFPHTLTQFRRYRIPRHVLFCGTQWDFRDNILSR